MLLGLWYTPLWAQRLQLPQPELITDQQGLPQGFVPGIVQDSQGFIWMATHDGLCRYDGHEFKIFRAKASGPSVVPFSSVAALQMDHKGHIWITSEQGEIVSLDPKTETFINISEQLAKRSYPHQGPRQYYVDRQSRLWLAFDRLGLVCYELTTGRVHWFRHRSGDPHSLSTDNIRCVLQDRQGTIWIGTGDAGLERFEDKTAQFVHYHPNAQTPLALPELEIYSLYQRLSGELLLSLHHHVCQFNPKTGRLQAFRLPDEDAALWGDHHEWGMRFTADSRGTIYCDQRNRLFRFSDRNGLQLLARLTPQTGYCSSLFIDRSDVLWVGTDGSGVRKYDLGTDGFRTARYQTNFQTDVLTNWLMIGEQQVLSTRSADPYKFRYTLDSRGYLWTTLGSSTIYRINVATHQCERVDFPKKYAGLVTPLATDGQGNVWLLFWENKQYSLWNYKTDSHQWIQSVYEVDWKRTHEIVQMVADERAFWFATQERGLFRLDLRTKQLSQYVHQSNQAASISSNTLYCLSADPVNSNRLWIGTYGKGLCAFDKQSGRCRRITEQEGLPNDVIYSAIPDALGNLWIGTNKGLCRLNRSSFQTRTYTTADGLLANEFNRFHYLHLPNGQIIMGGVEGITSFFPAQFQDDAFQPLVELTELLINNRVVKPAVNTPLSQPLQSTNNLRLAYDQNFITIQFAALQYNRLGKNRYRYQLEGLDPDWVESTKPQAVYTALPPGQYIFRVNATNTSNLWSPHLRTLLVTINPPWWRTWWAYLFYGMVIAGSIWYGIWLRLNQLAMQQTITLRQQEARQLRELDEMKSRFFTNVTHDFRTPLTLILSPITELLQDLAGTRYVKRLESMSRNAQQLLNLINQLLDFSKLEANALSIQEVRGHVGQFVEQALYVFREEAVLKTINFTYHYEGSDEYWFDADKLERILANLIGNALKFTPAGGYITITLQQTDGVDLRVSDTGVGIAENKLPYIFDRFFQVATTDTGLPVKALPQQVGTGIGLSLVKELVELQRGRIRVESQPGQGTTFHIHIPYRKADDVPTPGVAAPSLTATNQITEPTGAYPLREQPHLLLVEDNQELAEFISDSLPAHYRVSRALNGVDGLQQVLADLPDLVISDVMMPIMNGYTFCQKLKDDERTNHIPIILLTAKVTLDNRMEGLTRGADDYLTKPFHVQELALRIHNLLERQHRLRERVRQELSRPVLNKLETSHSVPTEPEITLPPNPFLEKLYTIIETKLDDTSFSVEELADQLNMSRVHLHRKLKALTGFAASDLIRNYRLKQATQLLQQGFNSSETAYRVGFDSPQYFAKCFREVYHMTPSEFAQKAQKTA
ncbi:two-component regulator propeller domain-containing protein [Spirosoma pulveris]